MEFVIKRSYEKDYFRGWAGVREYATARGRPRFGGTRDEALRFATRMEACREVDIMPWMVAADCEIEEVGQ